MNQALLLVLDRHNAATRLLLDVGVIPLGAVDFLQQIAQRAIAGHARRRAKQHLTDVDRNIRMLVDIFHERPDLRVQTCLVIGLAAVAVKLNVRQMSAAALQPPHRFERGAPIAGKPEMVGVDVHGMGQAQFVDRVETARTICLGVTPKWSTVASRSAALPACRCFHNSMPPGLTSLAP